MKILTDAGLSELIALIKGNLNAKENVIEDIDLIRAGAQLGASSIQKHQDISNKADKATTLEGYGITDAYTKTQVDNKVSAVFKYRGSVDTLDDLPTTAELGDVYEVISESANYSWTGEEWTVLGSMVDISNKADKGTTLADYGIVNAYTKDELSLVINNNNPLVEDGLSYLIKGATAFYNFKELSLNIYLMERETEGFHALNPMGGSGIYITNNTTEDISLVAKGRPYAGTGRSSYRFGYANASASASDIYYNLAGSDITLLGSGSINKETTFPLMVPAGMKGFLLSGAWSDDTEAPLEVTECYATNELTVGDSFQGMTIKTEALLPTPIILTQEEYDAIEPKKNTCMYFIIEE